MKMIEPSYLGNPIERVDGYAKVTGTALYAFEYPLENPTYLHAVQATVARGRVVSMKTELAEALQGVVAVITVFDAPHLADTEDRELSVLQDPAVHFRGQFIGAVIAETPEAARHAAGLVQVKYDELPHDSELRADRDDLYAPEDVNGFATDTTIGNAESAFTEAEVTIDQTYTTPLEHNNPMEPHACIAIWKDDAKDGRTSVTLYDSTQGVHVVRETLAPIFGLELDQMRVVAPHVGGGFGSKGSPHAHNVLAILAARRTAGRPVKFALTRQQMFAIVGYRTSTIQRIRLGANTHGHLTAMSHDVIEQTSKIKEYAEQTAVATRIMYATPNRSTSHRVAALDVAVPFWMRAPGETPGMYAAEVAMDELAVACGLDPIELRVRNEPEVDPESGKTWSGRHLIECMRDGAERFGWENRSRHRGRSLDGDWIVGTGMAAATYPAMTNPGSKARIVFGTDRIYTVQIGAADIGTGTWTALTQIAADALGCRIEEVRLEIGDTKLPFATVAGGSAGISSWGSTIVAAARQFRTEHGSTPTAGAETTTETPKNPDEDDYSMHSFGAHFVEARVHRDTGEIRIPRMLGVFSIGRAINAKTLRSQLIGGMTMGLSMALHEESFRDNRFGHVMTHDLANYHISTNADVQDIEAFWLDELDTHVNPMGSRGAGEIGIVGAAAAVVNAIYDATGVRVRDLPITADKVLFGRSVGQP
ncbi:xanthine dehydrogenase family protein molybdopterin-binding subunit [Rhodococcus qingshengii]|uniref:xanthine dehydrogenase family protein molybdopterin-binding subunit n=1 Tax=Rhodococcus qingshengii TaxID=334542 RepID=UPI0002B7C8D8|nr:xanthine dehydrogenase family protein molybdopterin-binding subunit [Rhodococcus qingshengii]EME16385.1 xanthine dehydrogenase, molybdenum binding subunit apoprotein [Rhodococcus qingshengii BKS 20-40]